MASFQLKILLPEHTNVTEREGFSHFLLRLGEKFSFQGMEDWSVDLGKSQKVLGITTEFYDLRSMGKMKPEVAMYFGKEADALLVRKILLQAVADVKVKSPRAVHAKDWMKEWRKYYRPLRVKGKRKAVWVYPSWTKIPASRRHCTIRISPGQAFGTGTHATTKLCIQLFLEEISLPATSRVLDFGAGTGILALAATKLQGAQLKRVDAVESDPVALEQCRKNAALNRAKFHFTGKIPRANYQLIFANVLAPVLLKYRKELFASLAPQGSLIVSGLLKRETKKFLKEFLPVNAVAKKLVTEGDWSAVLIQRKET